MGDSTPSVIEIEVAFALPGRQRIVSLKVTEGTTPRQAVIQAGLDRDFPELPAETFREAPLGIFGRRLRDPEGETLRAGDRVEVYRPLEIDPKAARAERASRE
jgi:putative ubiquitin-RnfH superfamily antitoxin RatB of RatAB toxin-antitoxin module